MWLAIFIVLASTPVQMVDATGSSFSFPSVVRPFHVSQSTWTLQIGDVAITVSELDNLPDWYSVGYSSSYSWLIYCNILYWYLYLSSYNYFVAAAFLGFPGLYLWWGMQLLCTVGHLPRELSKIAYFFIARGGVITVEMTGSRHNSSIIQHGFRDYLYSDLHTS